MDEISEKSRIFAVAAAGIQLSIKLIAFAEEDGAKPDRMSSLGHDIATTSGVLRQLGEFMSAGPDETKALVSPSGLQATMKSAVACNAVFDGIHNAFTALVDTTVLEPGTGMSTSPVYIVHRPFWQPHVNALWNDLQDLRLTLMLQLQITTLASCRKANGCNTPTAAQKKEQQELIQSIVALQSQQNLPREHMEDTTRLKPETEAIFRSAGEHNMNRHLESKDGSRVRKDKMAAEIRKDMESAQETDWRGSKENGHTNPQSPKRIATDSPHRGDENYSLHRGVDAPEIAEESKKVQIEVKEIERQNSDSSGHAQGELGQSSMKKEPIESSNLHGKESKIQPEELAPVTRKLTEEAKSVREYRPNFVHRIWSCFPWSKSPSLSDSARGKGILQLYFMEPYISDIPNGGLTIKWDTTLQAIDQRHIVEELARDEHSRRTSLVKQLAHLPDCEGYEIQQWLKELPCAAVLESVVRRTIKAEHNGIKMKKISSYRIITRLLNDEEVKQLPIDRISLRRRSMDSEIFIRDRERPTVGDGPVGEPQYILSKRDMSGGPPPTFPLDRPTFVKVNRSHLDPETLNAYRLPWVWDKHDPDYIIIKQWIPGCDQDILFEHTRLLRKRQEARPTYMKVHRKHLSPDTLDEYNLPWEFDDRDSRYIIIKRWIEEDFQDILFEHTRRLRARQGIGHKQPQSLDAAARPWINAHRPTRLSESDCSGGKDSIAESLLANCQSLDAAKEALEAAVRKRDAATGRARGGDAGGEEKKKKESVDELLGRYTTLFDAVEKSAPAVDGDGSGVEGEVSTTEEVGRKGT